MCAALNLTGYGSRINSKKLLYREDTAVLIFVKKIRLAVI